MGKHSQQHPARQSILRYFMPDSSPAQQSASEKQVAALYMNLANNLDMTLSQGPEKSVALRRLLESRDAALRSVRDSQQVQF